MSIMEAITGLASLRGRARGRVLYLQYSNPAVFPPLEHSSLVLARRGWDARFLGLADATAAELKFPPHPNIELRTIAPASPGIRQKIQYLRYAAWAVLQALVWRPDWIYVSDVFAAPIGAFLRLVFRQRTIYHEHDWPSDLGSSVVASICFSARRHLVRRADLTITPNAERARWLAAEGRTLRTISVVWNCPRLDEVAGPREEFHPPLKMLYQGSINSERLPLSLLYGMAGANLPIELLVVGYETSGSLGYSVEFRRVAEELGISDRVHFGGTVPRSALAPLRSHCHLGVAFVPREGTDRNFQAMTGASNKVFDYLAGGICPIVSDSSEWHAEFVDPGYALACDPSDPGGIARLLDWCSLHPERVREIGERGRERLGKDWNYEAQFGSIAATMNEAI